MDSERFHNTSSLLCNQKRLCQRCLVSHQTKPRPVPIRYTTPDAITPMNNVSRPLFHNFLPTIRPFHTPTANRNNGETSAAARIELSLELRRRKGTKGIRAPTKNESPITPPILNGFSSLVLCSCSSWINMSSKNFSLSEAILSTTFPASS